MDEADRFPPPGAVQRLLCFYLVLALLLALILVWRVNQPRQSLKAQLAEASAAMRAISIACQDYFTDTLELPRPSHLTNGTEADTIWNYQCLRENVFNIAGWQGPYLALDDWPFDPWGTPYGIDVLPCDAGCYVIVVSIGPNQVRDTPASLDSIGADCGDDLIIIGRVTMIPLPPAPAPSPPSDSRSIAGRFASEPSGLRFISKIRGRDGFRPRCKSQLIATSGPSSDPGIA